MGGCCLRAGTQVTQRGHARLPSSSPAQAPGAAWEAACHPIRISLCIPDCCWDLQPKTLVVSLFLCLPNTLQVSGSPQDR